MKIPPPSHRLPPSSYRRKPVSGPVAQRLDPGSGSGITNRNFHGKNHVGSETTGYRKTQGYQNGKTRLATAMAISGAAASPQMGTSTNKALRALLSLLNVRLNRWVPDPDPAVPLFKKPCSGPGIFSRSS
jgi:hypothetical protein